MTCFCLRLIAEKSQSVQFYDFLQVNTKSNGREVIDNERKDDEEVNQLESIDQQNKVDVSFIDFLSI